MISHTNKTTREANVTATRHRLPGVLEMALGSLLFCATLDVSAEPQRRQGAREIPERGDTRARPTRAVNAKRTGSREANRKEKQKEPREARREEKREPKREQKRDQKRDHKQGESRPVRSQPANRTATRGGPPRKVLDRPPQTRIEADLAYGQSQRNAPPRHTPRNNQGQDPRVEPQHQTSPGRRGPQRDNHKTTRGGDRGQHHASRNRATGRQDGRKHNAYKRHYPAWTGPRRHYPGRSYGFVSPRRIYRDSLWVGFTTHHHQSHRLDHALSSYWHLTDDFSTRSSHASDPDIHIGERVDAIEIEGTKRDMYITRAVMVLGNGSRVRLEDLEGYLEAGYSRAVFLASDRYVKRLELRVEPAGGKRAYAHVSVRRTTSGHVHDEYCAH